VKNKSYFMWYTLLAITVLAGISCSALNEPASQQLGSTQIRPSSPLETAYLDMIDVLMPGMGHKELVERRDSQMTLEKLCFLIAAPGREVHRKALCKAMMMRVGPEVAYPARVWILRKIEPIGRGEVVPTLKALLKDSDTNIRLLARAALQSNPSPKAAAALRADLATAKCCNKKISLINALAARRDVASLDTFIEYANSNKDCVALAAISALAKIGNEKARLTLATIRKNVRASLRDEVIDAQLRCAQQLLATGDKAEAVAIYESLYYDRETETVRIAALHGLVAAKGAESLSVLMPLIVGDDPRMQIIALRLAQGINGEAVTTRLAMALKKADTDLKILLIDTLGQRGDTLALPKVAAMLQSTDCDVRIAALKALQYLGNDSTALLLAGWATKTTDEEQKCARESLANIPGEDVDGALLAKMQNANTPLLLELIKAAAARGIHEAKPLLYNAAESSDEAVQLAALDAIRALAAKEDLPKLLKLLLKAQTDRALQACEKTVHTACWRMNDNQLATSVMIPFMKKANTSAQAAIIRVLGKIECRDALKVIVENCNANDKIVRDAAVTVLAGWSTTDAMDGLYNVTRSQDDLANRELALRGYIRLVVSNSGKNQSEAITALHRVRGSIPDSAAQAEADQALDTLQRFCVTWLYSGPYRLKDKEEGKKKIIDVAFKPEDPLQEANADWKPMTITDLESPNKLVFEELLYKRHCCAYAKTKVWSDTEQEVLLTLGSDDGVKAWLNGEVIHTNDLKREVTCDEDQVTVNLKQGWNPLLLKITQRSDSFGFCCAIKTPEGGVIEGLNFEAK